MDDNKIEKNIGSLFKIGVVAWFISLMVSLAAVCAVVYVVWHFVAKAW